MTRALSAFAATAASCGLYALAFPPFSWSAFAFVSLAPFFWALERVGWRGGLFLAWFWAVFASSFVADALPHAVEHYFLQPPLSSLAFAIGVWTFTGSLYYMGFAPIHQALARRAMRVWAPVGTAVAWAFFELLRGRLWTGSELFTGNPWALVAYSQASVTPLIQIAALGGSYAISFLIAWQNAGIVAWWRGAGLRAALAPAAAVGVAWAFGLAVVPSETAPADAARVAIVQGDLDLGSQWRSDHYGRNLDVYLRLTAEAGRDGRALVVWPEAALTFFLEEEPGYRGAIARTLADSGSELLVGGPRQLEIEGEARFTNSVFLVRPDGSLPARYDKRNLVPFAEFLPLRGIDVLRRRFERVRVFAHGEPTPPLPTRLGPAGILLCNEAMYPEDAASRVREGAGFLVVPSNDSWIHDEDWAELMFDLVALRAVEQRRVLVRASTSGPSAIVDPYGRVLARSDPFSQATVVGPVWARSDRSLYQRLGDAPWVVAMLAVLAAILRSRPGAGDGG